MIILSQELYDALVGYLVSRPFKEVAGILGALQEDKVKLAEKFEVVNKSLVTDVEDNK